MDILLTWKNFLMKSRIERGEREKNTETDTKRQAEMRNTETDGQVWSPECSHAGSQQHPLWLLTMWATKTSLSWVFITCNPKNFITWELLPSQNFCQDISGTLKRAVSASRTGLGSASQLPLLAAAQRKLCGLPWAEPATCWWGSHRLCRVRSSHRWESVDCSGKLLNVKRGRAAIYVFI